MYQEGLGKGMGPATGSMRISRITVHQVTLPIEGGGYRLSGGRLFIDKLDSTIVTIESDAGLTG